MWQRWCLLALCGMTALGADVCDGLPSGQPRWWDNSNIYADPPQTLSFRLSVKPGGPAFRITVRPFSHEIFKGRPQNGSEFIHAGDIEVARCQDGKQLQLLPIMAWQPLDFAPTFHAEDINFAGYLDFFVLTEYAAGWVRRSYWVYDPGSGLFVQNELTRVLREGCLGEAWHGACQADFEFDPQQHEIVTYYMHGCPGDQREGDRYRVENNRLVLVHKEAVAYAATTDRAYCTLTISDLVDGTLRVTAVRRFDFHGQPVP